MYRSTRLMLGLGLGMVLTAFFGCSANSETEPPPVNNPHFATDIKPILVECTDCHGASTHFGGLDLTDGGYEKIVNVASTEDPSALLVKPSDPAHSFLYLKILGTAGHGAIMPPDGALDADEVANIRTWIEHGALND